MSLTSKKLVRLNTAVNNAGQGFRGNGVESQDLANNVPSQDLGQNDPDLG